MNEGVGGGILFASVFASDFASDKHSASDC